MFQVFDLVNGFEYAFDFVNVSTGGRHSSIVVPIDTAKLPNVVPWYVSIAITDEAGTYEKAP